MRIILVCMSVGTYVGTYVCTYVVGWAYLDGGNHFCQAMRQEAPRMRRQKGKLTDVTAHQKERGKRGERDLKILGKKSFTPKEDHLWSLDGLNIHILVSWFEQLC